MEFSIANLGLAFVAGLASLLSPCVLPVVPIIVTGRADDSAYRPLLIVLGLAIMFISMGIVSSLAGHLIAGNMLAMEKLAGGIILGFGVLMLVNINPFARLTLFSRLSSPTGAGSLEGLLLGLTLGLVWIPCVGPMLSSVLAMVATAGQVQAGVIMLSVYSLGFAIPMLLAAYATQRFRARVAQLQKAPGLMRYINAAILILFGGYILQFGIIGFGL